MDEPTFFGPRGVSPRATFVQRFVAYLIDVIVLNISGFVISATFRGIGGVFVNLAIFVAYFVVLEGGRSGQTLGKRAVGIRVVDFETGAPIDYTRAIARTIGRWISGLVLLLGFFWMLWDRDRQTWHDKISSTTVVPVASFPIDRWAS